MKSKAFKAQYPPSPLQQGILFHTFYAPNSGMYVELFHWEICGRLRISAFERAWQALVERHTILRTAFVWEQTQGLQQKIEQVGLPLLVYDYRQLSPDDQAEQVQGLLYAERHHHFDIVRPPLMRILLIQMADERYHFIATHHHALLDGWSVALLLKEFQLLYEAFCENRHIHLPESLPYYTYIQWLQQQDPLQEEIFWRGLLKDFSRPTRLSNRPLQAAPAQYEDYARHSLELPLQLAKELQLFGRRSRLTLNTLIQGAWSLLLRLYSGEEDVLFGCVTSGRSINLSGIESMVGIFINTLPLRVQLSSNSSVVSWLEGIQTRFHEMLMYEYSSLTTIHGWSGVSRRQPLFESILVVENYPVTLETHFSNITISPIPCFNITNYPLTVAVSSGESILFLFIYDRRYFDQNEIEQIAQAFVHLLTLLVHADQAYLSDVVLSAQQDLHLQQDKCSPAAKEGTLASWHNPVDRKDASSVGSKTPKTAMELAVSAIWQELLKVDKINVDENFFDIGGHSLLALQLQMKLCQELDTEISLVEIFQYPTVSELAQRLSNGRAEKPAFPTLEERVQKRKGVLLHQKRLAEKRKDSTG